MVWSEKKMAKKQKVHRRKRVVKPKVKQFSGGWFREKAKVQSDTRTTTRKNTLTKAEYESF